MKSHKGFPSQPRSRSHTVLNRPLSASDSDADLDPGLKIVAAGSKQPDPNKKSTENPKPSGRATFDSRGTASWEWQTEEEGKFSADINTQRLKKLEATDLSLEDGPLLDPDEEGFDPYDRGALTRRGSAVGAAAAREAQKKKDASRKPIRDLRKYDEWLRMRKELDKKDSEDK